MVTRKTSHFSCAANFLRGRKCVFCGSFKVVRTARGYVKCRRPECGRTKSLTRLKREIEILKGFYQLVPAYRLAQDLRVDVKVVSRVYQRLREGLFHLTELEAGRLKGEIELDEAYFGGRRKGKRGRGAAGKSVVFGLLERDGRVYTKVVQSVTAEELMRHIRRAPARARCTTPTPFGATSRCNGTASTIRSVTQVIRGPAHQKPHQRYRGLLELCQAYPV